MRITSLAGIAALAGAALLSMQPAHALTYYLSRDLGVHGLFHLCAYSDGKIYSFNANDLCPLQVNDDGPTQYSNSGGTVGFKTGEYQDGMTKVCVYNVMGSLESIRIGAVDLCPLSYDF